MVKLLNSLYLGASAPDDYGKATGVIELLPFDLYLGAATPSGVRTLDVLLSGVSPLTLLNTIKLNYVKAFGKCEQDLTPTPSSPVNIVCNNGTVKLKDSELPATYQRIESIKGDGSLYYDTGEKLNGSDVITMTAAPAVSTGQNLFGAYSGTGDGNYNFSLYVYLSASSQCYLRYGNSLYRPIWGSTAKRTISIGAPTTTGFYSDRDITAQDFTTDANAWIFALPNSSSAKFTGTIYGEITVGNRLKYIPCRRIADSVVGYYEVNTETFLEPQAGTPTAGDDDYSYYTEVYADGTQETVTIEDENSTLVSSADCEMLMALGNFKDIQNITTGAVTRNIGAIILTGDEDWRGESGVLYDDIFTGKNTNNGNELCSHYTYDGAAMASMADNTFKVGSTGYPNRVYVKDSVNGTSKAAFNTWLKAQVANGTPVTIVYPLATSVSESVTPQTMTVAQGTNVVTATGSVSDLELEISYKAAVTVTIEEIEAVNTDESVEVTIS